MNEILLQRIQIRRAINGISLNGDETLLDEQGQPMEFADGADAALFLLDHGYDEYSMDSVCIREVSGAA
jgi:hypothetical protein